MKKRITSFLLAVVLMLGTTGIVFAAELRASHNLDDYCTGLSAEGNGKMMISVIVDGVGIQDKIGVQQIDIDHKASPDSDWTPYDTLMGSAHPEFYAYASRSYEGEIYFNGVPGETYRVTITVYAKDKNGSDTGYVSSFATLCK